MDPANFSNSPSGRLVPTVYDQKAFIPNPLPPKIDLNRCIAQVDRASRAIGELKGMSYKVNNPMHLINHLQQREAIASSSIEGTYTTASDLLLFDPAHNESTSNPDTREVRNYVSALNTGLELLKELPISSRLIRNIHKTLLQGVKRHRGSTITPGEFKTDQNFIGRVRHLQDARFVPPPPDLTPQLMSDLEKYINSSDAHTQPPVVVNALIHYQFETIHPFPDGNGRVGRLLVPLILSAQSVMPIPLLYISPFIEKNKDAYNDAMLEVSSRGDWEAWICFFAEAMENSSIETMRKINAIAELKEEFTRQVQQARMSGLLPALIELVFNELVFTIPRAQNNLNVTYRTAQQNIQKLVDIGILKLARPNMRPKYYICNSLIDLIFEK